MVCLFAATAPVRQAFCVQGGVEQERLSKKHNPPLSTEIGSQCEARGGVITHDSDANCFDLNDKTTVNVFLVNGIRLSGQLAAFDQFAVLLESVPGARLVFKHAISTVLPANGRSQARTRPRCR
ncbi:RNA chaperone Hfq [Paraburkholderia rhynchosiae]|nr:RNA chaperone Hfq [Paraburkholderia rhynchosiae]